MGENPKGIIMASRIDGAGTRQDSRPSSRKAATADNGKDHRRQVGTPHDDWNSPSIRFRREYMESERTLTYASPE
jgi:hypothetical protein